MSFPIEIIPNRGLGHILFGAFLDEVRCELGVPASNYDPTRLNNSYKLLFYDDPKCRFMFIPGYCDAARGGSTEPRLLLITAESRRFTLFGEQFIGETEAVLRMRLSAHGLVDPRDVPREEDISLRSPSYKRLSYGDLSLHIYLFDGIVTQIAWDMVTSTSFPS